MIVTLISIAFSKLLKLSKVGIAVIFTVFIIKLYGLWIVYYFSLESQNDIAVYFHKQGNIARNESSDDHSLIAGIPQSSLIGNGSEKLLQTPENRRANDYNDDDSAVQYSVVYIR
jgi:hypothetical protein